jgi:RNA polymerase sigma-70 factor (ECF subfamily)
MRTLVSTARRTANYHTPCPIAQTTHIAENARPNCLPVDWKRACILMFRPRGKHHMHATAEHGYEPYFDIPGPEKETRELQDVFSRYLPLLHRTAHRYLGNPFDAEDAVQDALLSAYQHIDQFRGQAQMSTWLVAIVINCARMQLRRRPRQIHVSLDDQFGEEQGYTVSERLVHSGPTPEEEYRRAELHERIMQLSESLSPTLRRAFQLRDLDGLTTSEAANILGVVDGTVKAQIARARAKLTRLVRRALDAQPALLLPARPCRLRKTSNQQESVYEPTLGGRRPRTSQSI